MKNSRIRITKSTA